MLASEVAKRLMVDSDVPVELPASAKRQVVMSRGVKQRLKRSRQ